MTKSKWFEEFNHDLLQFPPLVWVSSEISHGMFLGLCTVMQAAISTTVMQAAISTIVMQAAISTTVMQAAIVASLRQPDPPPLLLQVVQDFVQQTADEETPTEWLHRIMESNSREEGDYDINLLGTTRTNTMKQSCSVFLCIVQVISTMYTHCYLYNASWGVSIRSTFPGIFDNVDCHTLFLPATRKHLLQDLSKVYIIKPYCMTFVRRLL